jgi:hypothetical protein
MARKYDFSLGLLADTVSRSDCTGLASIGRLLMYIELKIMLKEADVTE